MAPLAAIAIAVIFTPLLAVFEPARDGQIAAVFPPTWAPAAIMEASADADVRISRFGALDNIVVVEFTDDEARRRLRDSGAWLLLPPGALGGCLTRPSTRLHASRAPSRQGDA